MKLKLVLALAIASIATQAAAGQSSPFAGRLRVADATIDACVASCVRQNESCKRTCPTTFAAPCLSSCDSIAETCRRACQK